MNKIFLAGTLLALLVLSSRDLQAQAYGPYYYDPYGEAQYQQYLQYVQQYDPYSELHVMHYQLYLPQYQTYQLYQPCCYVAGGVISGWSAPIQHRARPPHLRRVIPSAQAVVAPLPQAVAPLPRATPRR